MSPETTLAARGHPNVRARHRTTLMTTKEADLTPRGDCVVAVSAEKGPRDLNDEIREAVRKKGALVRLVIEVGDKAFEVTGSGDPRLTLAHPTDTVARKSAYVDDRTLMVCSDRAACDMDRSFVRLLQDPERAISVKIIVDS